jgi:hypothetical protein
MSRGLTRLPAEELVGLARGDIPLSAAPLAGLSVSPDGREALVVLALHDTSTLDVSHLHLGPDGTWVGRVSFSTEEGGGLSSLDGTHAVFFLAVKAPPGASSAEISVGDKHETQPVGDSGYVFAALWNQPLPTPSSPPKVLLRVVSFLPREPD